MPKISMNASVKRNKSEVHDSTQKILEEMMQFKRSIELFKIELGSSKRVCTLNVNEIDRQYP